MSDRVWTKPGPMTVLCGACGAEGVVQIRDGETWLSWGPPDVPEGPSLVEQLGKALEIAEEAARCGHYASREDYCTVAAAVEAWRQAQKGGTGS